MRTLVLLGFGLILAGCSSLPERVSQRFAPVEPIERVIQHDEARVFEAARSVLSDLGYEVTRSGAAQGLLLGESRRLPTEQFGASQQFTLEVRLRSAEPGVTTVTALVHQQQEGDFVAGATSTPLREHGRYDIFFERLARELGDPVEPE